jgi:hypothetical protein
MEIKTKFKPGDNVFIDVSGLCEQHKIKVIHIQESPIKDKFIVYYEFVSIGGLYHEFKLHDTETQCIKASK